MIFDARTGFLFISLLSLVISLTLWTVLWRQRGPSLHLWCGGGLAAAGASLLLAFSGQLPDLFGQVLAALLAFLMLLFKLQAIRVELGEPEPTQALVAQLLGYLALDGLLRDACSAGTTFAVMVGILLLMNLRIAGWAWRLGRRAGCRSARWITFAFGGMALMYAIRLVNAGLGVFDARLLSQGYDALLLALTGVLGITVSNLAWLGLAAAIARQPDDLSEPTRPPSRPRLVAPPRDPPARRVVTTDDRRLAARYARGCVILIDRDAATLAAWSAILERADYACETHGSAALYLETSGADRPRFPGPCCLVCALRAVEPDGLGLESALAGAATTPLLLTGDAGDAARALGALRAGALDFLVRPVAADVLLAAVARALAVSGERRLLQVQRQELATRLASLTAREREIAQRVAHGQRNQEIAESLGIALRTVKRHRQQVMSKMQVATLADLVRAMDAVMRGLGHDPASRPSGSAERPRRTGASRGLESAPAIAPIDPSTSPVHP